ncbi:SUZ RNA-binding domain-containing-like [Amphiura filiformis]|uniref:SUZ RNA-binding domain-containing-like n=1 Tax=Amphiura filiformis TaxID=82378 RepID=UPI003B21B2BA
MADDGDVWDSWEDMVDSGGLDKRLEKEEQTLQESRKKEETSKITQQPIVLEEETHRTQYQPTLKLMRRQGDEDDNGEQQKADVAETNKALPKSLAERQAEYEQARLRILGSAKNEEDEEALDRSMEPARTSKPATTSNSKQSKPANNVVKSKKQKNTSSKSKKGSSAPKR